MGKGQARFSTIPVNELIDGVTITRFASAELRLFNTAALSSDALLRSASLGLVGHKFFSGQWSWVINLTQLTLLSSDSCEDGGRSSNKTLG